MKEKERERGREGKKEIRKGERDRWDLGKVLAYSTSMNVNSCISASISADLHNGVGMLNTETAISTFLTFPLVRLTLIPGLHYLPDIEIMYLPYTH